MGVVITIYKSCYPSQAKVSWQLLPLCEQVEETEESFRYKLNQSKLLPFLHILNEYRVPFGLDSSSDPHPGLGMQSLTQPHSTEDN